MAIAPLNSSFYADPTSLSGLKRDAATQTPAAVRETAKQFESLFTTMMLKSMRDATPGESLFGSDQQDFYQDMFDQQLSVQLSKGKGMGLADVLVKQLMQGMGAEDLTAQGAAASAASGTSAASAAGESRPWPPRSHEDFVSAILPAARAAGQKLGVDPSTIVAHAALETGWGQSIPAASDGRPGFNLFGIKANAGWKGDSAAVTTHEYEQGSMQSVKARFRVYESPEHSLSDYANLLGSNPRYAAALGTGTNVAAFGRALQQGGYATDPDYAKKLTAVADELKSHFVRPISAGEA